MRNWCVRIGWVALLCVAFSAASWSEPPAVQPPVDEMYGSDQRHVSPPNYLPVPVVDQPLPPAVEEESAGPSPEEVLASMGYRSEIERAWFDGGGGNNGIRGAQTRHRALELGAENLDGAARALIADSNEAQALSNRLLAVRLAPDLPLAHIALASEKWRAGEYREALEWSASGIMAIPRNLDATVWLVGSLLVMFGTVLIASSLVFVLIVGASVVTHAAHDLGDLISNGMPTFGRAALMAGLALVPLALGEGPLGFVMVVFAMGCVYGGSRHRVVLALAALLMLIGMYPIMRSAGAVLTAFEADPVASAALAVVRGTETISQVDLLRDADLHGDELAVRVLAVRARRLGDVAQATERLERLVNASPDDVMALTMLGNIAFQSGRTDEAIGYYERAQTQESNQILLFNLSQAYAKAFRMEEFEYSLARAQEQGSKLVGELSRIGDTEFVADIPFPISSIRSRMIEAADGTALSRSITRVLVPGWLGQSWLHLAGCFLLIALLGVLVSGRYQPASLCSRCGGRICSRCDDTIWNNELCDGCHHLFNRPQSTDPELRMARLQSLRARESRLEKIYTGIAVLVPGASGLLAQRPDLGFMGLFFFTWSVVLLVWREGVVPDPLSMGSAGGLAFLAAGIVMALLYLGVLLGGLMIRRSL